MKCRICFNRSLSSRALGFLVFLQLNGVKRIDVFGGLNDIILHCDCFWVGRFDVCPWWTRKVPLQIEYFEKVIIIFPIIHNDSKFFILIKTILAHSLGLFLIGTLAFILGGYTTWLIIFIFLTVKIDFLSDQFLEIILDIWELSLHVLEEDFTIRIFKVLKGRLPPISFILSAKLLLI